MSTAQIKNNDSSVHQPLKQSALERLTITFEYNKTLQEIKREVRQRTI